MHLTRLDQYLYDNGFCRSRSLGAKLIRAGFVFVDGRECTKPSEKIDPESNVEIRENPLTRYVSRGGLKLETALKEFGIDPRGALCIDIGASTGGFTDCLLQHGARRVYAIDSGSAQLHPSLKENECVVSMENTNARFLDESMVPVSPIVVMDVSFISQSLLYPAVAKVLAPDGVFISLIKPQFEVGRESIGSGGIVRNEKKRLECIEKLREESAKHGLIMEKTVPSPITGGDGNTEYLALFRKEKKES
ncbi:MAG: TlyA family RNA methyltransferase [Clostridia bacterium]|nr:TlyA family RNA methyltransferase [Clostridia bacterium]